MLSIKKQAPYKEGAFDQKKTRTKLKKMRTLVRQSSQKNQEKFMAEMELKNKEEKLKVKAKKSKKYEKKLKKFLEKKQNKIENIWKSEKDSRPELILRDFTHNKGEDNQKTEDVAANVPVSDARLKAYGL